MILLDTHALLWWRAGGKRLSRAAARAIDRSDSILVSPVSFWEVGVLESKGAIRLDRDPFDWVRDVLRDDRMLTATMSPSAAMFAGRMPGLGFDVTAPKLRGAGPKTVRVERRAESARVAFKVTATDGVDGAVPVSCKPRSGSRFEIGRTKVRCNATDSSGNTATAEFTVTVER